MVSLYQLILNLDLPLMAMTPTCTTSFMTRQRFWADRHLRGAAQVVEEIIRGDFVE